MRFSRPRPKQRIPADAKSVFKGIIFEVYQWPQRQFDGSVRTFEGIRRADSVKVIPVTNQQKVLIIKERQPGMGLFYDLVSGRAEDGESVLRAAKRELLEETGYSSDSWHWLFTVQPSGKIDWMVHYFVARSAKKIAEPEVEEGEEIELCELDFESFVKMVCDSDFFDDREIKIWILKGKLADPDFAMVKDELGLRAARGE